eukprot:NODE_912_length_1771_cov_16.984185_g856_i0.p1 GENE.NODE_912_length_1771_cov_16.984185_g856_i0~~NODE_912_length_1771_cov_16.984185_g856_i0.p1  ORF type:complete len:533 (-),score=139.31 NODE_912_length_1771_cov_16.984185_g856_i0:172-1737(-)
MLSPSSTTPWVLLHSLHKHCTDEPIVNIIAEAFEGLPINTLATYLPQLLHLYHKSGDECQAHLRQLFCKLSARCMRFALLLWWQLKANEHPGPLLYQKVETFAINGTTFADPHLKCAVFTDTLLFMEALSTISAALVPFSGKELRSQHLKAFLGQINATLTSKQVFLPFDCEDAPGRVVSLLAHQAVVLNSRDRVPYLVLLEVVPQQCVLDDSCSLQGSEECDGSSEDGGRSRDSLLAVVNETWEDKVQAIRSESPFGDVPGWKLVSCIFKAGDNMCQEMLAMQLLTSLQTIWAALPLYLRPYQVLALGPAIGLIETVPNASSLDSIKKTLPAETSLRSYFHRRYGPLASPAFQTAQRNFVHSLAAYSLVSYLFQIKDRHNGNILLLDSGHLVHIDFGFMLNLSPGGMAFEPAFKLSAEYIELMEGEGSPLFHEYTQLMIDGFLECRKHTDQLLTLVELSPELPCFGQDREKTLRCLRGRLQPSLEDTQVAAWIGGMVQNSVDHWRTRHYDAFQRLSNGIL